MLDANTRGFYERVLADLRARELPFLVGGAYALRHHTGLVRETKDLDLFVLRSDVERILDALAEAGHETEFTYAHWLGKVRAGDEFVDLIFSSGNGVATVDPQFFAHAAEGTLFGQPVLWCPVEETIWSKAFVMERERYDGADVAHLLRACSTALDWPRLLMRFGEHWRVLLSHLVLFGFIYPSHQSLIPRWVMQNLLQRMRFDTSAAAGEPICGGTLLSRAQFLTDVCEHGYQDARLTGGAMSEREIADWTAAISGSRG